MSNFEKTPISFQQSPNREVKVLTLAGERTKSNINQVIINARGEVRILDPLFEGESAFVRLAKFEQELARQGFNHKQIIQVLSALQESHQAAKPEPKISLFNEKAAVARTPLASIENLDQPEAAAQPPATARPILPTHIAVPVEVQAVTGVNDVSDIFLLIAQGDIQKAVAGVAYLKAAHPETISPSFEKFIYAQQVLSCHREKLLSQDGVHNVTVIERDDSYVIQIAISEEADRALLPTQLEGVLIEVEVIKTIQQLRQEVVQ